MAINLSKGQKIDLKKRDGTTLKTFYVGANWGAIEEKGFFGSKKVAVDLDLSIGTFSKSKELLEVIYFGNLSTNGIKHSGDDLVGDEEGDDGLDNEVIEVNLNTIDSEVDQIVFVLNSYKGQDFATIPYASLRIYEGKAEKVDHVVATYNIAHDAKFANHVSMILGKLSHINNEWKFTAIGEAIKDKQLRETLNTVEKHFL